MLQTCSLLFLIAASFAVAAPPNTSLVTLPVAYYGSSYPNKTQLVYDMFSKMRVVILMQQDGDIASGHCWELCCPEKNWDPVGRCQNRGEVPLNASLNPGCSPSCDQHGKQNAIFAKIKQTAREAGRPEPHAMLYMNSVYDWPFDATHGLGAENIDVLDINGKPHMEQCDPGIYPSFFLDFGRSAGRAAFLNMFKKYIVNGIADGVYLDCFDQMPLSCGRDNCTAVRNKGGYDASIVSRQQVTDYIAGKKQALTAATEIVRKGTGGMFPAKTWMVQNSHDPYGANTAIVRAKDPAKLIRAVNSVLKNGYKYVLVDPDNNYSNLVRSETDVESKCSDFELAKFLLALQKGCFLICQGWAAEFKYPLGDPLGPASTKDGVMSRSFESGTKVSWVVGSGNVTITWAKATVSMVI